ncbi:MAG: imidazole glycerol phosphate synthase subunit HisH [Bacteroidales bacterium]|jgi:glutamine amidotransferase
MKIAIIKYNAGNIMSVDYALQRLGIKAEVTNDKAKILSADKVIFPGVGEASTTMAYLKKHGLDTLLRSLEQPVLGICLGMQLMCKHSTEGDVDCIGIFDEEVVLFKPDRGKENITKVPHMGWNDISDLGSRLFDESMEGQYVYFVHSYYATLGKDTIANCNYILPFSAAMHKDNFYATQFHPEKSGPVGAGILKNFIEKC